MGDAGHRAHVGEPAAVDADDTVSEPQPGRSSLAEEIAADIEPEGSALFSDDASWEDIAQDEGLDDAPADLPDAAFVTAETTANTNGSTPNKTGSTPNKTGSPSKATNKTGTQANKAGTSTTKTPTTPKKERPQPDAAKEYSEYAVSPAGPRTTTITPDTYTALDGTDVTAIATKGEEATILNEVRKQSKRFDARALQVAQKALGVTNASGAFNTETLRKLATKTGTTTTKAKKGKPQTPALITAANIVDAAFWLPFYGADQQKQLPLFMQDAVVPATEDANDKAVTTADRVAQKLGAKDYKDYHDRVLQNVTFLKKPVRGGKAHPELASRLAAAEKFLENFFRGKKNKHNKDITIDMIPDEIGWKGDCITIYDGGPNRIVKKGRVVQKADPAKGIEEKRVGDVYAQVHQHNMGLAIDFDPAINPYIFDKSTPQAQRAAKVAAENAQERTKNAEDRKLDPSIEPITAEDQVDPKAAGREAMEYWDNYARAAYKQAADLYGGPALTQKALMTWSATLSTEELHAKVSAASKAMEQYLTDAEAAAAEDAAERAAAQRAAATNAPKPVVPKPVTAKLLELFKGAGYTEAQAKQGIEEAKRFPKEFWHKMGRDGSKNGTGTNKKTNQQSIELAVALRDAGGLMWGGTEMSHGDNGDFMHFDLRGFGVAQRYATAVAEVKANK